MTKIEGLLAISLIANCLLFIGFLYLKNTLQNTINLLNGVIKRMGIEIQIVKGKTAVKE